MNNLLLQSLATILHLEYSVVVCHILALSSTKIAGKCNAEWPWCYLICRCYSSMHSVVWAVTFFTVFDVCTDRKCTSRMLSEISKFGTL